MNRKPTGYKDKNNKEILEGDIVEAPDNPDIVPSANGVISFKDGEFWFTSLYLNIELKYIYEEANRFGYNELEIKGNVKDNSELIPKLPSPT